MHRSKALVSICLLGAFSLPLAVAQATELNAQPPSVESRIEQLEARVAELQTQLEQSQSQFEAFSDDYDAPSEAWGWVVAYESTFLIYHRSSGVLGFPSARVRDSQYEFAPRVWVGYTGPTGIGVRARYWDLNEQLPEIVIDSTTTSLTLDDSVFDLEVTNWIELGRYWSVLVSGGWRFVDFEETRRATRTAFQPFDTITVWRSLNVGGTLGGELYAHVSPNASLFATGKAAVVFGGHFGTPREVEFDNVRTMWESQLGVECKAQYEFGEVFVRLAAEVQYWDHFSGSREHEKAAIGFSGFTTTFGIIY
jgi:hypothetical protein